MVTELQVQRRIARLADTNLVVILGHIPIMNQHLRLVSLNLRPEVHLEEVEIIIIVREELRNQVGQILGLQYTILYQKLKHLLLLGKLQKKEQKSLT